MLLTLAQVRQNLWTYANQTAPYATRTAAQEADAEFRINQVVERFLTEGKWKFSLRRITIPINDGYVTLPREMETALGLKVVTDAGCCCISQIYTRFHEFAHPFTGCCSTGSYPVSETVAAFISPEPDFFFRVKSTVTSGTISFYGGWDTDDEEYFGGETLNITNGSVNGTRTYNVMPGAGGIQKTATTVPVELYSVDGDGVETLIAVYGPNELVPSYKKYKVPDWNSQFTSVQILGKLAYVEAVNDYDIIVPSHWGALKLGLKALRSEDTEEDDKADKYWERAYRLLNNQVTEAEGDNELPVFKVQSEFGCEGIVNVS